MPRLVVAPAAVRDIHAILAHSHERFGFAARERYEALLTAAMQDLVEDPQRAGTHERPDVGVGVRSFHVRHSRGGGAVDGRVKHPRHFLVYRLSGDGAEALVEIVRILHDGMDLRRHVANEGDIGKRSESSG